MVTDGYYMWQAFHNVQLLTHCVVYLKLTLYVNYTLKTKQNKKNNPSLELTFSRMASQ